jgi:RNA polymerase sigma-70 factor, ECF subfamily
MSEAHHGDADAADRALVARWRQGDQRAASALVARHAPALARYAASQGVGEGYEDLVQDTFVRAFRALEGFRGDSSLRTWLFTIMRRLVIDARRAGRLERRRVAAEPEEPVTSFGALDAIVAAETEARVRDALATLTPTQREVFSLRVAEGLSYKEIARIAGTTEGAARVHYHNAMRAVKEYVDDE